MNSYRVALEFWLVVALNILMNYSKLLLFSGNRLGMEPCIFLRLERKTIEKMFIPQFIDAERPM